MCACTFSPAHEPYNVLKALFISSILTSSIICTFSVPDALRFIMRHVTMWLEMRRREITQAYFVCYVRASGRQISGKLQNYMGS